MKNRYKPLFATYEKSERGIIINFTDDKAYISDAFKILAVTPADYKLYFEGIKPYFPKFKPGTKYVYNNDMLTPTDLDLTVFFKERPPLQGEDTGVILVGKADMRIVCCEDFPVALNDYWYEIHKRALAPSTIWCGEKPIQPVLIEGMFGDVIILPIRLEPNGYADAIYNAYKEKFSWKAKLDRMEREI